jgi:hypothetical protein
MADANAPACPTCRAGLSRMPRPRSKCRACGSWIYPSFKSVFQSTLLTEAQHTVAKALDDLQARSPANASAVSDALPRLRAAQGDKDALALATRDLFTALEPRDDFAAAEIHWHQCAELMAQLGQDFDWALRRSAEALLDRRMLEAVLSGSSRERVPAEQDVVLTVCYQPDACDPCRSTGGYEDGSAGRGTLRFTIAEARKQHMLPHKGCRTAVNGTAGFCRCRYKAV